jgi:hypothetical protein
VVDREQLPGASHAGLNLVVDQQDVALGADRAQRRKIIGWRNDEAALSLHRLHDDARDVGKPDLGVDDIRRVIHARHPTRRVLEAKWASVAVGERHPVDFGSEGTEAFLVR